MATAEEKLAAMINKIMDDREAKAKIESDPKAAGAALATDLREFLGEWRAAKQAKAGKPAAKSDDDSGGDTNILSALFGG